MSDLFSPLPWMMPQLMRDGYNQYAPYSFASALITVNIVVPVSGSLLAMSINYFVSIFCGKICGSRFILK